MLFLDVNFVNFRLVIMYLWDFIGKFCFIFNILVCIIYIIGSIIVCELLRC